ncbi:MAG: NAD(P)-dependent oxidoreductase, partial [Wujia sp.]
VSGGVSGAVAGTLTLMVGGDKEVFDRAVSILECIGKNILYIGEIGSGDAMKLVNNLMLGCNMAAAAEAIVLGQRCGIDLETIKKVITISSGNSYAFQAKIDKFIIPEKYDGGFAVSLQHKDLGLALEAAENVKMSLRMGEAATGVFETAMSEGYSGRDISSVTEMWQNHFNAN